jgi:hypothetical protein
MKKTVISLLTLSALTICSIAQEKKTEFKLYGFIRNDAYYNSRMNKESLDGLNEFYPLTEDLDANGKDRNAIPQSEMISIGTRIGLDITGIDMLGAKTSAKIETDFGVLSTVSNSTYLNLRHAYFTMGWNKVDVLAGQTWHPLFGKVYPSVLNLNTGAPFQPFARDPQINVTYKIKDYRIIGAAIYQLQYMSDGPLTGSKSNTYLKTANMPELYLGFEKNNANWICGFGGEVKQIVPRLQTPGKKVVSESLSSFAVNAYGQYTKNLLAIKAKVVYGQNLSDLGMIGGYGIHSINPIDSTQKYTAFNMVDGWLNVTYGKKVQVGILGGYTQNLGTNGSLVSEKSVYGMGSSSGKMIGTMYRISPEISYNTSNVKLGLEYDYSLAKWGDITKDDGIVRNTKDIVNHRILAVISYWF